MGLSFSLDAAPGSVTRRDLVTVSHVRGRLLLVLSTSVPENACHILVDQWMVDDGWSVDHKLIRHLCEPSVLEDNSPLKSSLLRWQGTAQLIVAGSTIYHPDWIALPWQTCMSCT